MLGDDRGQSIQIGAILLFGILIIGLAFAQTVVVPAENESVEFNGYVETTEDLVTFRNDVVTAGTQGSEQAESIQTGVRYPSRAVLINPGPPVGSLATTAAQNVSITGAEAVGGEDANVRGYWSATEHNYSTQGVRFSPAYNNIDVPPIETSGSGVYRLTDNGPLALTSGAFISGNRLTIVTIDGDISTSSMTTSVAATPASVATRSVALTERSDEELNVTIPVPGNGTEAAAVAWNQSSAAQSLRNSNSVDGTSVNGTRVDVTLDGSQTYELRLARVVVHDAGDSGVDVGTEPQYLVALTSNGTEVPTTGTREISVEVRDRYNNPLSGVDVEFTASGGSVDGPSTVTTDSDGSASVALNISDSTNIANVSAEIVGEGVAPYNSTTVRLLRQGTGGSTTGTDNINPSAAGDIRFVKAEKGESKNEATITFNNTRSESVNITSIRFSFYLPDSQNVVVAEEATVGGKTSEIPGVIDPIPNEPELLPGQDTVNVSFASSGGSGVKTAGDFFIITVTFDKVEGRQTYFISVRK